MKNCSINYLIMGLGRSGLASYQLLKNCKGNIYLYDCNQTIRNNVCAMVKDDEHAFVVKSLSKTLIDQIDTVLVSPAIDLNNKYIHYAKKKNKKVISEIELGFCACKNDMIAITGTNGKTTTVSLIAHIFNVAKRKCKAVGNIGVPLTGQINNDTKKDVFVCEVSSFQLEAVDKFKPHVAGILNIDVDHLDRHKTIKNYVQAKYNIANNLNKKDYLIINNYCKKSKVLVDKVKCKVLYFDTKNKCIGAYVQDGKIYANITRPKYIMDVKDIKLIGEHNLQNVLCAILCAYLYKIKPKYIQKAVSEFESLKHRLQTVAIYKNVKYIDDSKATNIQSTLTATKAINQSTTLILCGNDKGYEYKTLFDSLPANVERCVCCGGVKQKLLQGYNQSKYKGEIVEQENLKSAVEYCFYNPKTSVVLLSPASASFDEFTNYAQRGEYFGKCVKEFIDENKI